MAKVKISADITYKRELLDYYNRCRECRSPLLMFGCDNPNCENHNLKNLLKADKALLRLQKINENVKE